jgi:Cu-Zn family superoxide dismutase
VLFTGRVSGLTPNTQHGFHVHQVGDCSAADASSAGDHFNPTSAPHGKPTDAAHHAGDLPNTHADPHGDATINFTVAALELGTGGATDIFGRALVVHARRDDFSSQPAGNSGDRVACGVIAPAASR